jgi:hypothetical protein
VLYNKLVLTVCKNNADVSNTIAHILQAHLHAHSMSRSSMWASPECHCFFWIAGGLVSYLTMWLLTLQLFKNSIDTQERLRLNFHLLSVSVSELLEYFTSPYKLPWFQRLFVMWKKREARMESFWSHRLQIPLPHLIRFRFKFWTYNQVWKWDLQSVWPEALRSCLSFLSPRKEPLEPGNLSTQGQIIITLKILC